MKRELDKTDKIFLAATILVALLAGLCLVRIQLA
tara:strand:+ start:293 stop:394 length:102 start_codon:yes stop_codon:yes gene_type:complete